MKYSENYHLWLPEDTDPVRVSDLSENFENIDEFLLGAYNSKLSIITGKVSNISVAIEGADAATRSFTLDAGKPIKCILAWCSGRITTIYTAPGTATSDISTHANFSESAIFAAGSDIDGVASASEGSYSASVEIPPPNNNTKVTVTASFQWTQYAQNFSASGRLSNFRYIMFADS